MILVLHALFHALLVQRLHLHSQCVSTVPATYTGQPWSIWGQQGVALDLDKLCDLELLPLTAAARDKVCMCSMCNPRCNVLDVGNPANLHRARKILARWARLKCWGCRTLVLVTRFRQCLIGWVHYVGPWLRAPGQWLLAATTIPSD